MNNNYTANDESESNNLSSPVSASKYIEINDALVLNQVPSQLHAAQQEINNLRLLNFCLQSTLIRVQTQLIEYLPTAVDFEIQQNERKQRLAILRQGDDHSRRNVPDQQISFFQLFDNVKNLLDVNQKQELIKTQDIPLSRSEKQIDVLHEMFHELNTLIHTEHNDRICQLYITLAETSHSVSKAQEVIDNTVYAHKIITHRKLKRRMSFLLISFIFVSMLMFVIIISIRIY